MVFSCGLSNMKKLTMWRYLSQEVGTALNYNSRYLYLTWVPRQEFGGKYCTFLFTTFIWFADCILQSHLMCFICNLIKEKTDSNNQNNVWISDLIMVKANDQYGIQLSFRCYLYAWLHFYCQVQSLRYMKRCCDVFCSNHLLKLCSKLLSGSLLRALSLSPHATRTFGPQGSGSLTRRRCQQVWQRSRPVPRVWSPWHFPFVSIRWAYMNVLETIPFSGDWKALLPCPEIADEVVDSSLLCRCAVHCGTRHVGSHFSVPCPVCHPSYPAV